MTTGGRGFLRDNIFLVAAVALPALVIGFFLLSAAIPRWLVPPPAYDLVLRVAGPYEQAPPRIVVDFNVRDGRVEATVRPLPPNGYPQKWTLFVFDHQTMNVREIPVDLPTSLAPDDAPRTIVVDAFGGRQVFAQAKAPDGYELETRSYRGPGLVGELFGMNRSKQTPSLVKQGRVVPIALPSPYPTAGSDRYHEIGSAFASGGLSHAGCQKINDRPLLSRMLN